MRYFCLYFVRKYTSVFLPCPIFVPGKVAQSTGTRIPDPPFSSFGPSRDYGMDLCLEVYL